MFNECEFKQPMKLLCLIGKYKNSAVANYAERGNFVSKKVNMYII
jgi:hypothetical protein